MKNKLVKISFLTLAFLTALPVQAASIIDPTAAEYKNGDYSLNSIVNVVIGASQWILGIVGSLALLMFIYGGVSFLISAGESAKIQKAKNTIVAAAVGLVVVFSSWLIVRFTLQAMGLNWKGGAITSGSSNSSTSCSDHGTGYSCMDISLADQTTCLPGLCSGGSNVQCCQPSSSIDSSSCKNTFGSTFQCMSKSSGRSCKAGYCPGGSDIECCQDCASVYGGKGYSCMDKTQGSNCKSGLCLGDDKGDASIQCCQPK